MHPVLRKGPLFTKKTPPPFSTFSHKKHFTLFFTKKRPISTFFKKNTLPFHFLPTGLNRTDLNKSTQLHKAYLSCAQFSASASRPSSY